MTHDSLAVYLQDHLAGATAAIDLLSALRDQHAGEDLGEFCGRLLRDIESDHGVLESLSAEVGRGSIGRRGLAARAESQHDRVEEQRLRVARRALRATWGATTSSPARSSSATSWSTASSAGRTASAATSTAMSGARATQGRPSATAA